jgi:SAM-dependent methyltransferase
MMPAIVVVETAPRPTSSMPSFPSADLIADACVTGENYIIRDMFRWFRTASPVRETGVAMVDPRQGDALLVILMAPTGAPAAPSSANAALSAACAAVTGLNGRTVVVGRGPGEQRQIEAAAAAAGALVEFVDAPPTMLPLDNDVFDVVVIMRLTSHASVNGADVLGEAVRVARPAGRILAITGQKRAGIFGALQTPPPAPSSDEVLALLKTAGGVAARRLATVEGVSYFEARKPRG